MTDDTAGRDFAVQPTSPVGLLALGLGPALHDPDLEGEIDLEAFLCAAPDLELHGCLGRGGMGLVYRARQTRLDRIVAVKLMIPELATDPEFVSRFEREARALARLDHPGVVRVHDFGEAAGVCYLVMEYVEGTNLRALMEEDLEPDQAAEIIGQLCEALAYAHGRGVVHRDIKPENVLIDRDGRVKVADFGLAKLHQDMAAPRATRTRRVVGTPQYMAPEQLGDPGSVDHRADIFAIGVVFYEMLTGQLPVGRFPSPSELGRGDARLDAIVLRSLESNRDKRFQAASEIRDALATREVDDPAMATAVGVAAPGGPSRGRFIVAAGAGLAAAGLGVMLYLQPTEDGAVERSDVSIGEAVPDLGAMDVQDEPPAVPPHPSNRWPSRELASLHPETAAVIGIDWGELQQAPGLPELANAALHDGPDVTRCWEDVVRRTHKVIVALDAKGELADILVHGEWSTEEIEPCLRIAASAGAAEKARSGPRPQTSIRSEAFGPYRRFEIDLGDDPPRTVVVAKAGSTILLTLRAAVTEEEVGERLAGRAAGGDLRERVAAAVDLGAPVWGFAEPVPEGVPLEMQALWGELEIWESLGVDLKARFATEDAAAHATKLLESYATILDAVEDESGAKPEIRVERNGLQVQLSGVMPLDRGGKGKITFPSNGFGLNVSMGDGDDETPDTPPT